MKIGFTQQTVDNVKNKNRSKFHMPPESLQPFDVWSFHTATNLLVHADTYRYYWYGKEEGFVRKLHQDQYID